MSSSAIVFGAPGHQRTAWFGTIPLLLPGWSVAAVFTLGRHHALSLRRGEEAAFWMLDDDLRLVASDPSAVLALARQLEPADGEPAALACYREAVGLMHGCAGQPLEAFEMLGRALRHGPFHDAASYFAFAQAAASLGRLAAIAPALEGALDQPGFADPGRAGIDGGEFTRAHGWLLAAFATRAELPPWAAGHLDHCAAHDRSYAFGESPALLSAEIDAFAEVVADFFAGRSNAWGRETSSGSSPTWARR